MGFDAGGARGGHAGGVSGPEDLAKFADAIAHDFNNILQTIEGAAALLQRRADDPDAVRRLATMIQAASARGGAVTRRLLAFVHDGCSTG
ncbi:MAG: histidine kinase dimerization/phospho-acceptor domain-containing protein [Acetobacteraceae bacterium]